MIFVWSRGRIFDRPENYAIGDCCRNIALTLIDPGKGEQKAQSCVNAWLRQLSIPTTVASEGGESAGMPYWRNLASTPRAWRDEFDELLSAAMATAGVFVGTYSPL